jgi:hypothetical protein
MAVVAVAVVAVVVVVVVVVIMMMIACCLPLPFAARKSLCVLQPVRAQTFTRAHSAHRAIAPQARRFDPALQRATTSRWPCWHGRLLRCGVCTLC